MHPPTIKTKLRSNKPLPSSAKTVRYFSLKDVESSIGSEEFELEFEKSGSSQNRGHQILQDNGTSFTRGYGNTATQEHQLTSELLSFLVSQECPQCYCRDDLQDFFSKHNVASAIQMIEEKDGASPHLELHFDTDDDDDDDDDDRSHMTTEQSIGNEDTSQEEFQDDKCPLTNDTAAAKRKQCLSCILTSTASLLSFWKSLQKLSKSKKILLSLSSCRPRRSKPSPPSSARRSPPTAPSIFYQRIE